MAQYAPELPTTPQLADLYPIGDTAELEISLARERIGGILTGRNEGLVAIIGPCAMNHQVEIIAEEGERLKQMTIATEGLYGLHRMPPWKPRTNPEDWHGRETDQPEAAYRTLATDVNNGTAVSIELAHLPHAERYGDMLSLGWFGGRNIAQAAMMHSVALQQPDLPLAVKNGLNGEIDAALEHAARLNHLRGDDATPTVLLYRGGENAQDPKSWEEQYLQALATTAGRLIVDVAHGSEMAHDPNGNFKKSAAGQIAAMEHVIDIARSTGQIPAGIMLEASNADSPTDPHMPFEQAIEGVLELNGLRNSVATTV